MALHIYNIELLKPFHTIEANVGYATRKVPYHICRLLSMPHHADEVIEGGKDRTAR